MWKSHVHYYKKLRMQKGLFSLYFFIIEYICKKRYSCTQITFWYWDFHLVCFQTHFQFVKIYTFLLWTFSKLEFKCTNRFYVVILGLDLLKFVSKVTYFFHSKIAEMSCFSQILLGNLLGGQWIFHGRGRILVDATTHIISFGGDHTR